jgi:3-phenylpropionate/trans-cinnamate dioxygenase ferredoxin subunit
MTEDENVFAPLCASEDIEPGKESVFKVNGRDVLVCRSIEGELFAVEDICPHANACLSGGRFRNGFYACPHHGARFELSTGKSMTNLSTKPLICFDIKEENGKIEIIVPEKKKVAFSPGGAPPGFGPPM